MRERQRALGAAHQALARRERTVAEMRAVLERKRVEPDMIEEVLEELGATGLLDDASYARRFTEDRWTLERWGSERIARDLGRRGVAPEHVEAALAGRARSDELATALVLLEERLPVPPADDRGRDRAWRLLIRRGYEPELAYEAVRAHERAAAA